MRNGSTVRSGFGACAHSCALGRGRTLLLAAAALASSSATDAAAQQQPHRHLKGARRAFAIASVTPAGSIQAGQSGTAQVVITRSGGHNDAVTLGIAANAQGITGSGAIAGGLTQGTLAITVPAAVAPATYALLATAGDGAATRTAAFDLAVTAAPAVISTFTATPATIAAGQTSTLAYTFSGGAGAINNGVGSVTSGGTTVVSPAVTTTYTLTVTPLFGPAAQAQATVTVTGGSATMATARAYHTETLLPNGKVLLAGGRGASSTFLDSAELYDPATGLLAPTGSMSARRVSHTATLLGNGKVLIAGGFTSSTNGTTSAELYDPATGLFTPTGSMTRPRGTHTATLLPTGEVLITGGYSGSKNTLSNFPTTCELYSPASGTFRDTGSLLLARGAHRATLLMPPGPLAPPEAAATAAVTEPRVLISGGYAAGQFVTPLELYGVGSGSVTPAGVTLLVARALHTAMHLPSQGKVLFAGGAIDDSLGFATNSCELYDVAGNTIAPTGSLAAKRGGHTSTLAENTVYVTGGSDFATVQQTVEVYDPATGLWSTLPAQMSAVRTLHTATLLPGRRILLTGGAYASGFSILYRDTVEVYPLP
jgi:hypothetical protein